MKEHTWVAGLLFLAVGSALSQDQIGARPSTDRSSAQTTTLQQALEWPIIGPDQTLVDVQAYTESRVIPMPSFRTAGEWERYAKRLRERILSEVIFRGEAAVWAKAPMRVEWLETIPGGPGYRIRKLRYEALPGLWIPALLYEPEELKGRVPVVLNVNGHEREGKSIGYKQIRCINLAKKGLLALNVEWFGMGQLRTDNFLHYRINQLDLCGTSGIAVHYLYLQRAVDLLLSLEHADPDRLAVTGLSGGGWQTIFLSALDRRVDLANPVAGYSSYRTRARFLPDLGDSEQTPSDLAAVADYTHLTALMAPRPTLLTHNAEDPCCFRAGYALDPLLEAARPIFRLYDRPGNLRHHVNDDPGTHNYGLDNRKAFYQMLKDFFYSASPEHESEELPSDGEVKTSEELAVDLPDDNADFHSLALALSRSLPRHPEIPENPSRRVPWQQRQRIRLEQITRTPHLAVEASQTGAEQVQGGTVIYWKLRLGGTWTVPAVEIVPPGPRESVIVISDEGRSGAASRVQGLLEQRKRVVVFDPFYFGESRIKERDFLYALLLAALGDRPLGLQAGQVMATAGWLRQRNPDERVTLLALGPRSSLFALIAAALDEKTIASLSLVGSLRSLREVIERNQSAREAPELFCFGLLEAFDIKQLTALVSPRLVQFQ